MTGEKIPFFIGVFLLCGYTEDYIEKWRPEELLGGCWAVNYEPQNSSPAFYLNNILLRLRHFQTICQFKTFYILQLNDTCVCTAVHIILFWSHSLFSSFSFYFLSSHPALGMPINSKITQWSDNEAAKEDNYMVYMYVLYCFTQKC